MSNKYQISYDVTDESQVSGYHNWSSQGDKAQELRDKIVARLEDRNNNGIRQMGSTFLVTRSKDMSAQELLNLIINRGYDGKGEYFTDSERAHIKMSVADVSERDTDEDRLATYNIEE